MSKNDPHWIPYAQLVKENKHFNPCPVCGGEVMQARDLMIPRLNDDPRCQHCKSTFKPHKKWHLLKGFLVISAK